MITYEARYAVSGQAITFSDLASALKHKSSPPHPTLWQIERESETEAAVRRWKAVRHGVFELRGGESLEDMADRFSPPPLPKETQLDWNTGEPIEAVHCWQIPSGLFMAANVSESEFKARQSNVNYLSVLEGRSVTSTTRDAAIANLRAIRALLNSKS
jgi:hypothetical protein